jgi:flagellar basal-body rod modification protein FlgD
MSTLTGTSATEQKLEFMKLLITQLQNQNPLEPVNSQDFAAQLAQFTQLELTEKMNTNMGTMNESLATMNSSFQGSILIAQMEYAKSLLGKEITFYTDTLGELTGQVKKITFKQDGQPVLNTDVTFSGSSQAQTYQVGLDQLSGIIS